MEEIAVFTEEKTPIKPMGRGFGTGAGAKKGVPWRATRDFRLACARLVDSKSYRAALKRRLLNGKVAPAMEVLLWHYAHGKPADEIKLDATLRRGADAVSKMSDEELRLELMKTMESLPQNPVNLALMPRVIEGVRVANMEPDGQG